jgi:hypothetical protein
MEELTVIDLESVSGGGGFLRSIFGGALQGLASSVQSGQVGNGGIWRNMLSGAIQSGASTLAAKIQGGGAGGESEQPAE